MGLASIVKLVEIFTIEMEESSKTENEAVQVVYVSKNTTPPANIELKKQKVGGFLKWRIGGNSFGACKTPPIWTQRWAVKPLLSTFYF